MSSENYEFSNPTGPIGNTTTRKALAVAAVVDSAVVHVDLQSSFGNHETHFYEVVADGCKVYISLSEAEVDIDATETGTSNTACFALADGKSMVFTLPPVDDGRGGGVFRYLNVRAATGASGYARISRSTLGAGGTAREFFAP